jgi:phosphoenolpyruvate-protein phosphotransferase/dihydroxyacetone kinase phosphotransfer subunit
LVGIVVVSHSARLAEGVVELAREMGGPEVPIEAAGGLAEPRGALGTDAMLVKEAIEAAHADGGVLVLMDLGSALMSAEMAAEMVEAEAGADVLLCEAPLVEGAVAAAATARVGAPLDEVASEARRALRAKAEQLGVAEGRPEETEGAPQLEGPELRVSVPNRLGLHARPAARFVAMAAGFDADVSVFNETTGRGPANARSLTAVAALGARQGHELRLRAAGPQAGAALAALAELADGGFGDAEEAQGAAVGQPPAATSTAIEALEPGSVLTGLAASSGVAVGAARRLVQRPTMVPDRPADDPDVEWSRLARARAAARSDIERTRAGVAAAAGEQEAAIFDAHLLLLDDEALVEAARRAIYNERQNAAKAWHEAGERAADEWGALDDAYLRERAADVRDVAARVVDQLAGGVPAMALEGAGIVVAAELTPGQAASLDRGLVRGIATAHGTATSHAAILARGLGIPAVVGLGESLLAVPPGTLLLLDGDAGRIQVDPPEGAVTQAEARREAAAERAREARARAAAPAATRDGQAIEVAANVGVPADAVEAVALGADGVGLLRTEFLFLGRDQLPDEEEQLAVYREIAAALDGRPLVARTLDVGADKPLPGIPQESEENPFLGRRGIRLALAEPELLRVQLRALLRAAAEHPIKIMFPMVTALAEFRAARAVAEELQEELGAAERVELGVMVEVPAVALSAEIFAREVDFFSIGTNDLAQYTMAAERGNERVAHLADGPLPQVLRLIEGVTRAAADHGRWVGVCGELAGDPVAAALFAGLGVTELSMAPPRIPEIKDTIRGLELATARTLAQRAIALESADEVRALVGAGDESRHAAAPVSGAAGC